MIKHWINGREVESKDTFTNYNPATGEAIGEVASGGAEAVSYTHLTLPTILLV